MAILFKIGITVTFLGVAGLITCIIFGFKIRHYDKQRLKNTEEIKKLLTKFSSINMLSLMTSLMGIIILAFSIILK